MIDASILATSMVLALVLVYVASPLLQKPRLLESDGAAGGSRRREALLARKAMIYQSLRDAELDRQTGKLSEEHHREMSAELRARAAGILRELDEPASVPAPAPHERRRGHRH